jgi:thiazole synthase ThiGH ThiG subunit
MLELYGKKFTSRMLLGTAGYASPDILRQAVETSGAEIVTVSLRRESARARTGQGFWELIEKLGRLVLPNTAGCRTAKEAVATAQMARELFGTTWIKLEVIANDDTLQPELFGLRRRFPGAALHHRGLKRRGAAGRRGLRRAHAMGVSHRLRARTTEQDRAAFDARLFS